MQVEELRELDAEELSGRLKGARRELFELRFKLAVGQLDNPQQIKTVRREIARILTIVHERLLDEQVNEAYAQVEPVATLPVEEAPAEVEDQADTPEGVEESESGDEAGDDLEEAGDEGDEPEEDDEDDEDGEDDEDDEDDAPDGEEKE